jgi:MFS transporter, putative metabolite:H+ symporter
MSKSGQFGGAGELIRRLDRLPTNRLHLSILIVLGSGLLFDTLEAAMSNVLATVFAQRPGVSADELKILLTSVFIGGAIGAPLAGRIADRIGRRSTLVGALIGYGIASVLAGFARDVHELSIARLIGGFFLAAYPPLLWTYLTDVLPPHNRGRLMMIASAMGSLGAFFASFASRQLDGWLMLEGWQSTLILGGAGGLVVAIACSGLPESPRWLERRGRTEAAKEQLARFERSVAIGSLPPPPAPADEEAQAPLTAKDDHNFRGRLALVIALQFLQPFAIIGFAALSGIVLGQKGHDIHSSLLFLAVAALGSPAGAIIASTVVDRFARHQMYIACAVAMAVLGLSFALVTSPAALMAIGGVYMILITIFSTTLNIYAPEMFVTERRGFATGLGHAANRLGAAAVPSLLLPLLLSAGAIALFSLIAGTLLLSAALVFIAGPRNLAGHALQ